MSVADYSNNVKKVFIQPVFDSTNFRSEFRFDNVGEIIATNLTLINHGATADKPATYLRQLGLLALIKKITLFDGNQKLTGLSEFNRYASFKKFNRTNNNSKCIDHYTDYNNLGCDVAGKYSIIGDNSSKDIEGGIQVIQEKHVNQMGMTFGATKTGMVNLNEHLHMLRKLSCLPTDTFKNLRLVIDYEQNFKSIVQDQTVGSIATLQPLLCVDVITNPELASQMLKVLTSQGGVSWNEIEHDRQVHQSSVNPPSTATDTVKDLRTHTFHGFDNKRLGKVVVVKEPLSKASFTDASSSSLFPYGSLSSLSLFGERVQFRVNGSDVLSRTGFTGHNEMLGHMADTFGEFVAPCGAVQSRITNMGGIAETNDRVERDVFNDYANISGFQGYVGIDLSGVPINELQIDMERAKVKNSATNNQDFNIHLFGEVPKALMLQPNGYNVVYA